MKDVQIKRREQEFLFVTMKGEKKEIESIIEKEGKRREENKKKQGKEAKKPAWPLFFFLPTESVARDRVQQLQCYLLRLF